MRNFYIIVIFCHKKQSKQNGQNKKIVMNFPPPVCRCPAKLRNISIEISQKLSDFLPLSFQVSKPSNNPPFLHAQTILKSHSSIQKSQSNQTQLIFPGKDYIEIPRIQYNPQYLLMYSQLQEALKKRNEKMGIKVADDKPKSTLPPKSEEGHHNSAFDENKKKLEAFFGNKGGEETTQNEPPPKEEIQGDKDNFNSARKMLEQNLNKPTSTSSPGSLPPPPSIGLPPPPPPPPTNLANLPPPPPPPANLKIGSPPALSNLPPPPPPLNPTINTKTNNPPPPPNNLPPPPPPPPKTTATKTNTVNLPPPPPPQNTVPPKQTTNLPPPPPPQQNVPPKQTTNLPPPPPPQQNIPPSQPVNLPPPPRQETTHTQEQKKGPKDEDLLVTSGTRKSDMSRKTRSPIFHNPKVQNISGQFFGRDVSGYIKREFIKQTGILDTIGTKVAKKLYNFNFPSIELGHRDIEPIETLYADSGVLDVVSCYMQKNMNAIQPHNEARESFKAAIHEYNQNTDPLKIKQTMQLVSQIPKDFHFREPNFVLISNGLIRCDKLIKSFLKYENFNACAEVKDLREQTDKLIKKYCKYPEDHEALYDQIERKLQQIKQTNM